MVYKNGDKYNNACDKAERTSVIYLVCDKTSAFKMIEENNERDKPYCDYIFELKTPIACDSATPTTLAPVTTTTTVSTTTSPGTPTTTTTTTTKSSSSPDTTKSSDASTSSAVPTSSSSSSSPTSTPSSDQKRKSRLGPIPIILIV